MENFGREFGCLLLVAVVMVLRTQAEEKKQVLHGDSIGR